jgi:hypothetical protein
MVGGKYRVTVKALAMYLVDQAEGTEGVKLRLGSNRTRRELRKILADEYADEIRKFLQSK